MARKKKHPESAAETLAQIESTGDRLAEWVGENPIPVLGAALAMLLVAGVWGLSTQSAKNAQDASAAALATVQEDYRVAMGASPGAIEIAEPANPETARRVRNEYVGRYEEVAAEYAGDKAAALALMEAGGLQVALGEPDAGLASYARALDELGPQDVVRAFVELRIAAVHEAAGRFAEAAAAYLAAAEINTFPLRFDAFADAARMYVHADDREAALATFARIDALAPDYQLPPHVRAQRAELLAASQ